VATRFIISSTSTGFVAVRERPTTQSAEVRRLNPGTEVACIGVVTGQLVAGSDQWAECPAVGGYIFAQLLLTPEQAAAQATAQAAAPPPGENAAIEAAVRAHVGTIGFAYTVSNICIDGDFALATVAPVEPVADPVAAVAKRTGATWEVIYFGPGMTLVVPGGPEQIGVPANFACIQQRR
jgi:hypothetical protein